MSQLTADPPPSYRESQVQPQTIALAATVGEPEPEVPVITIHQPNTGPSEQETSEETIVFRAVLKEDKRPVIGLCTYLLVIIVGAIFPCLLLILLCVTLSKYEELYVTKKAVKYKVQGGNGPASIPLQNIKEMWPRATYYIGEKVIIKTVDELEYKFKVINSQEFVDKVEEQRRNVRLPPTVPVGGRTYDYATTAYSPAFSCHTSSYCN